MRNKAKSRQGSVLFTVIVVSMMMMVLIAASISLVGHTNTRTNQEYRSKQAYFLASSCIEGFVAEATNLSIADGASPAEIDSAARANIQMLQRIADDGNEIDVRIENSDGTALEDWYTRGMGSCKIKLEKNGSANNLKAIATATYLGQESTVVAYFSVKPLSDQQPMNNALEIIGTDGGQSYNNIQVFGNTSASDLKSHQQNTVYTMTGNSCKFCGNMSILGSLATSVTFSLGENPYYTPGNKDEQTPGGSLTVSRSFVIGANVASIVSQLGKNSSNIEASTYNYLNVGECAIFNGTSGVKIGQNMDTQVDVYASNVVFGSYSSVPNSIKNAMKASAADPSAYETKMNIGASGDGQIINGNLYTYANGAFNGDIYFNGINNVINGDIYCSGDIYFNDSRVTIGGNVYMLDGKTVHGTAPAGFAAKVITGDWTNINDRAKRPAINTTTDSVQQYVYFPEHMLCQDGVSQIKNTYEGMYEADKKTIKSTVKSITDPSFRTDDSNKNVTVEGKTVEFKYIVTESCYIDTIDNNDKILIDMDNAVTNADGRKDIVIILKNGGHLANDNLILVRNSAPDYIGENKNTDQPICYFVSDAGVGTTNNEYGNDNTTVSTYDHSTFNANPTFQLGYTTTRIMELETYVRGKLNNQSINTTNEEYPGSYTPGCGKIVFLLTEGTVLNTSPNTSLIQANIYAPRATVVLNNGDSMAIEPAKSKNGSDSHVNILGSLICAKAVCNANNNTVWYQQVSPNSMLPAAKGSKAIYSSGFKLVKYANS